MSLHGMPIQWDILSLTHVHPSLQNSYCSLCQLFSGWCMFNISTYVWHASNIYSILPFLYLTAVALPELCCLNTHSYCSQALKFYSETSRHGADRHLVHCREVVPTTEVTYSRSTVHSSPFTAQRLKASFIFQDKCSVLHYHLAITVYSPHWMRRSLSSALNLLAEFFLLVWWGHC